MAYPPPPYNALNFNFRTDGYVPQDYTYVEFNFVQTSSYLVLGDQWSSIGLGPPIPFWNFFAIEAQGYQVFKPEFRWKTLTPQLKTIWLTSRWETFYSPSIDLVFWSSWDTAAGKSEEAKATLRWNTKAYATSTVKHGDRWVTTPVKTQNWKHWDRWGTTPVTLQTPNLWDYYSVATPGFKELQFDEYHDYFGVTLDALVFIDYSAVYVPAYNESLFADSWWFNYMVANAWVIRYPLRIFKAWGIKHEIGLAKVKRGWSLSSPLLQSIAKGWSLKYAIRTVDEARRSWSMPSAIVNGSAIYVTTPPTLTVGGVTIPLDDVDISMDEGQYSWTCNLTLTDPAHYTLFDIDTPFSVTIGGETYSFICNEPSFRRDGHVDLRAAISGVSPSAQFAEPRAVLVTKTWETPTLVSDILEEVFGVGVVTLNVLDWSIPADRLAVDGQTPVGIATSIAEAIGGLLESEPDGSLFIRYRYPVSVLDYLTTSPDQTYDDVRDEFTMEERYSSQRVENRFRIMDSADEDRGILLLEIDAREEGFNSGRTSFTPGDQPVVLVYKSIDVELNDVDSSAGDIAAEGTGTAEIDEYVDFVNTNEAEVRYPIVSILEYKWLGNDLGAPTFSEETKLTVPTSGIGRLKIKYTSNFIAKRLVNVPIVLNGETEYGVLVVAEGSQT